MFSGIRQSSATGEIIMKLLTVFREITKANCKKTYLCDLSLAHFEVASVAVCNSDSFHVLSILFGDQFKQNVTSVNIYI